MRIVGEIPHPRMKVTCFHYNNKFSLKFEKHQLEQIIKFRELPANISSTEIMNAVNQNFLKTIEITLDSLGSKRNSLLSDIINPSNDQDFPQII